MRKRYLLSGDVLALLAFVLVGKIQHGLSLSLAETGKTAAPFLAGWLAAGLATGLYRLDSRSGKWIKKTIIHILLGVPLSLLLRVLLTGQAITLVFTVVTMMFTAVFILGWRLIYVRIVNRKSPHP